MAAWAFADRGPAVITSDLTKLIALMLWVGTMCWDPDRVLDFAGCHMYRGLTLGRGEWVCFIWICAYLEVCLKLLFLQDWLSIKHSPNW